jgi:hypothetical protein
MYPYENRDNKKNFVLVYGLKTYGISKIIAALILISELNVMNSSHSFRKRQLY